MDPRDRPQVELSSVFHDTKFTFLSKDVAQLAAYGPRLSHTDSTRVPSALGENSHHSHQFFPNEQNANVGEGCTIWCLKSETSKNLDIRRLFLKRLLLNIRVKGTLKTS